MKIYSLSFFFAAPLANLKYPAPKSRDLPNLPPATTPPLCFYVFSPELRNPAPPTSATANSRARARQDFFAASRAAPRRSAFP